MNGRTHELHDKCRLSCKPNALETLDLLVMRDVETDVPFQLYSYILQLNCRPIVGEKEASTISHNVSLPHHKLFSI
ncbi:unnamed protein product [Haemonchus placei]|uniref:ZP domain-containing protein n=1 Tax=Haemonchus placei TaxID=6290 RepID=A0A0N4WDK0_HAEPC|nr:unnamed protein product [Haemonchus placei]